LCLLAEKIGKTALVELGNRLAPVDMAPIKVIRRLARDEAIEVAAPVLTGSRRLSTTDLVDIVQTRLMSVDAPILFSNSGLSSSPQTSLPGHRSLRGREYPPHDGVG
jgi:hypothetical protein